MPVQCLACDGDGCILQPMRLARPGRSPRTCETWQHEASLTRIVGRRTCRAGHRPEPAVLACGGREIATSRTGSTSLEGEEPALERRTDAFTRVRVSPTNEVKGCSLCA